MLSGPPFTNTVEEIFVVGGTEVYRVDTLFLLGIFHLHSLIRYELLVETWIWLVLPLFSI